ncbi:MAG: tetratricopeptide repeat protein [Thermoplasmatota archaeon]
MRGNEFLKRASVETRILLLLHQHEESKDAFTVPEVLSQGGMSKELDIRQNNLSRSLQELISKGFVSSRSAHVLNKQRRRKVYFLTPKGIRETEGILSDISSKLVLVQNTEGTLEEWTLERFLSHLELHLHRRVTVHEALNRYLDGNEADLNLLSSKGTESDMTASIPKVKDFHGRFEELDILGEVIDSEGPRLLSILGIAGQGKTTLVSQFFTDRKHSNLIWMASNRWMEPRSFLMDAGRSLKILGRPELYQKMSSEDLLPLEAGVDILLKGITSKSAVLVIDDAHRLPPDMSELIRLIKNTILKGEGKAKVIIISRERPDAYTRSEALLKEPIIELELGGLDREAVSEILSSVDIPPEQHDMIFDITRGHPLALSLLKASPEIRPEDLRLSLDRFLNEEVLVNLTKEERSVLEMASVMEEPVKIDCFTQLDDVDAPMVFSLQRRMLLREYGDGSMDLHDAVRDAVKDGLTAEMENHYREKALDYFSRRGRDKDLLSYIKLCRELGKTRELIELFSDLGEYLLGRGYPMVMESLKELLSEEMEEPVKIRLMLAMSEAKLMEGDREGSMEVLREAARICEDLYPTGEEEGAVLMARILGRFAEVHLREGVSKEGMDTYKKSLGMVRKTGNLEEEGKVLNNMGTAYLSLGELDLARDYLTRAFSILKGLEDGRGAAICRLNLGEVHQRGGDFPAALKEYLTTSREAEKQGLDRVRFQAMFRTGNLYMMVLQPREALHYYRSALAGYIDIGDLTYSIRLVHPFISSALKSGKTKEGVRMLSRIKRSIRRMGRLRTLLGIEEVESDSSLLMATVELYLTVLENGGKLGEASLEHIDILLSAFDQDRAYDEINEIAFSLSRDFKGPSKDYLQAVIYVLKVKGREKVRARTLLLLSSTYPKGSTSHRNMVNEALDLSRKGGFRDLERSCLSMLARTSS